MARRTLARLVLVSALLAAGLAVSSTPARADFHLMKVREVSAGTAAQSGADFIELQMVQPDQGNVSGHVLHLYSTDVYGATIRTDCTIPANVLNESDNARILFGTADFVALPDPDPDFTIPPLLHADSGAACFEGIDCVSWGSFSGMTTSPAAPPFPGGIPPGQSIDRKGVTEPQDTDNSTADFVAVTPSPQANDPGPPAAATCGAGPPGESGAATYGIQSLKAKARGNRATVSGRIAPPAPGKRVWLTFFADGSPLKKMAKKQAALNSESRFKKRFKVPVDSTRCKVIVRFEGQRLGQKKLRC
jgi:hypothetical protein